VIGASSTSNASVLVPNPSNPSGRDCEREPPPPEAAPSVPIPDVCRSEQRRPRRLSRWGPSHLDSPPRAPPGGTRCALSDDFVARDTRSVLGKSLVLSSSP